MNEETPVTEHVHQCVKLLNSGLHQAGITKDAMHDALEGVLELVDLPWDEHTEEDGLFREGYETCLLDVVGAIAQAWGVGLPRGPR